MPMQIRAQFFFKDLNGFGWSEALDSTLQNMTAVFNKAVALIPLRVQMLGTTSYLQYVRVSDQLVKRDSLIASITYGDGRNTDTSVAGSASANLALLLRLTASDTSRRLMYIKGFPDNCESDSGVYTPTVKFRAAISNWKDSVLDGSWAVRSKDDALNPPHLITAATQDNVTGNVTITTADAHGFSIDKPIAIAGVKGATQLNGRWSIQAITSPTAFRLHLTAIIDPYVQAGTARLLGFAINPILTMQLLRVTHRIAGRPFDSPRGRRRGKKRV